MKTTIARGIVCLCVVTIFLVGVCAQAATVSYWKFDEKEPGNPADIDPIPGAIIDSVGGHNGDAFGGDPLGTGVVMPQYVAGPTPGDSALRLTLQDWDPEGSYVGEEEDAIYVNSHSDFDINLSGDNVYTIEAVVRAPDPMTIMNSTYYQASFPQWYDYTDNAILGRGGWSPSSLTNWWAFALYPSGEVCFDVKDSSNVLKESHSLHSVTGGLWHHVAVKVFGSSVADNRKLEFYIDGQLDNTVSISSLSGTVASGKQLYIATQRDASGERWSDQFVGDIDSIRFSTGTVTFLPAPTNTVPTMNIAHVGTTDPNTEAPLRLCDRFYGEEANSSTWTASGYTLASGQLQEAAASAAYYRALLTPEQLQDPAGWTLTGKMKLVASNKPWNQCMAIEDGTNAWVMSFTDSAYTEDEYNPGAAGAGVYKSGPYDYTLGAHKAHFTGVEKMGAVDPTAGFHTYQMIYDPTTDKVSFYVDGAKVGEQDRADTWNRDVDDFTSKCRVFFGDNYPIFNRHEYFTDDSASDAYWGDVKLQTGKHLAVPWDPNFDGVCGAGDLDIVRANWGQAKTANDWAHGELTGDGVVGAADLDLVRSHWGQSVPPPPGIGPVPEPSTIVLLIIGGFLLLFRRLQR